MTYEQIKQDFIERLKIFTHVINEDNIDSKQLFEDLHLLDYEIFNIITDMEDLYGVDTSDTDMEELLTVKDVVDKFLKEMNKSDLTIIVPLDENLNEDGELK